ncbi:proteasome activator pa28 [Gigaspora rosea]|uniref:Proteasome activator pa28 n=1 Tax=Gigaspora rosea TaxID=44941 RepID=A0A397UCD4_9GLOM|nr:proteasome activator pa28 [Gigaspora rosea]
MSLSDHFVASSNPQNLDQFHSKLKIQSLEIINQIFPRKILELSNLLQYQKDGSVTDLNFSSLTQRDDAKSRKRRRNEINDHSQIIEDVESVLCDAIHMTNNDNTDNNNDNIMCLNNGNDYFRIKELHKILEDEVACFAGYCCKLRAWVTLKYPSRIGTEENPKISAQEDITAELSRVEDSSFLFLDSITRYYVARTKLCKTYYKFPTIQDSHHALYHLDKQHLISILHHLEDMCNIYVIIYDMLQKNMIYLT